MDVVGHHFSVCSGAVWYHAPRLDAWDINSYGFVRSISCGYELGYAGYDVSDWHLPRLWGVDVFRNYFEAHSGFFCEVDFGFATPYVACDGTGA